jgi:GNAT superfamily N-acetyltransferase
VAEPAPRFLPVQVTQLEMAGMPARREQPPSGPCIALMRAVDMPLSFYRYLYREVGKPHHWFVRRSMDDEALAAAISPQRAEIFVLYVDGCPAGFFELDLTERPETLTIHHFGLIPEFQGRGLAKYFLSEAIFAAWAHQPEKVAIETNTLDSPKALILYQRAGFSPVGSFHEKVLAWE